jgi:Flp pilus assembly protein TadD
MPTPIFHYCQRCVAANPLGQDFCVRCGTRLMIVVEPTSARFELNEQAVSTDEHLLERISILENRVSRLTERLERTLDLLLRQVQNSYFDRSLVKTLIGVLSEDGFVEASKLEQLWNQRCEKDALDQQQKSQRDELRSRILASPPPNNSKAFADLVGEGFLLLQDRQTAIGIDKLLRAADLADSNSALNLFIGEHFFRDGQTQIARTYLSRAHQAAPDDVRVSLLLGLSCADDGDSAAAKELLANALERGWVHMVENRWRKALSEFKRALEVRPSPEAHFALASLYYKLDRDELARRHLNKAIEMDSGYQEALQLLAVVYDRIGQPELARDVLSQAAKTRVSGKRGKSRRREKAFNDLKPLPHGLINGADRRLSTAVREDALRAFSRTGSNGR